MFANHRRRIAQCVALTVGLVFAGGVRAATGIFESIFAANSAWMTSLALRLVEQTSWRDWTRVPAMIAGSILLHSAAPVVPDLGLPAHPTPQVLASAALPATIGVAAPRAIVPDRVPILFLRSPAPMAGPSMPRSVYRVAVVHFSRCEPVPGVTRPRPERPRPSRRMVHLPSLAA